MKKEELLRYTGSMQQLAYARRIVYDEGRARNLNAVEVKNGPMRFVVMLDKCLDISELSYYGENVCFLSKPGLNGRNHFDTNGLEARRSIMCGLFFTCGYENICAPNTENGVDYPMHGRMRTTPAEHVSIQAGFEGEDYIITVSGDMREAELFGENILLHRTIRTVYGRPCIEIRDEITNEAFERHPFMLMYHCNMGYPYLTEDARIILPSENTLPRDEIAALHLENHLHMEKPKDNEDGYCYMHTLKGDDEGNTFAAMVDDRLKRGITINYNRNDLPEFGEWKSIRSGDYVLGLEPGNCNLYGRPYAVSNNRLPYIEPLEKKTIEFSFTLIDNEAEIAELDKKREELLKAGNTLKH